MNATLESLKADLSQPWSRDPKMFHPLPRGRVVDRWKWLPEQCRDKVVLSIGASGPMQARINAAAAESYGIDKEEQYGFVDGCFARIDVDNAPLVENFFGERLTRWSWLRCDLVVLGEILEHLSNPGRLLDALRRYFRGDLIVSVPNAYSSLNSPWLSKCVENINADHVAWHSPATIRELLRRAGWTVSEWLWHNGPPPYSETIIVVAR